MLPQVVLDLTCLYTGFTKAHTSHPSTNRGRPSRVAWDLGPDSTRTPQYLEITISVKFDSRRQWKTRSRLESSKLAPNVEAASSSVLWIRVTVRARHHASVVAVNPSSARSHCPRGSAMPLRVLRHGLQQNASRRNRVLKQQADRHHQPETPCQLYHLRNMSPLTNQRHLFQATKRATSVDAQQRSPEFAMEMLPMMLTSRARLRLGRWISCQLHSVA